ncbi:MAG TPA: peptidylprolyl isomerase [Caulobacteraceae bacterium]|nr:peptidylprolyl isomerase [Caulobacteraceae bacterium]
MLRYFRAFTKSWFGPAIMGAILVALTFLGTGGIRNMIGGRIANAVVQAGSRQVTQSEFQKMFQRNQEAYQQRTGQPFPLEQAVKEGADKNMLQELAAQTAYFEMLSQSGIRPSDDVVAQELKRQAESGKSPGLAQMFDAVTGKFRPDALQALLHNNNMTMDQFQRELADEIADNDFQGAIAGGFAMPRIYAAIEGALALEARDITYFVIPESSVPMPKPTDAQLAALMQQHKEQLMLPERRRFTVVRFSAKALAPTLTVDPKAVEQQFQAAKASYTKPETRSLVEITLNDPSKAAEVAQRLGKGEDPQAVAKSVGGNAISYTDQPQSAIADQKAAAAAFAMKEGQVSGPVQGDFKTVVLKVTKVTPAQAPDLNAARAQIEAQLRQAQAVQAAADLSNKFDDLVRGGASVTDAAAKVGVAPISIGPVNAEGKDLQGQVNPALSPKVVATAFQLSPGGDSEVSQDAAKGEYYAVHLDQVLPPAMPSLDEPGVRPAMTQAFIQQTVVTALQQKAATAQAALQKGQSFEAVAATFGATVSHQLGLQQANAQQQEATLGRALIGSAFQAKQGQVFTAGSDPLKGFVVARLDAVHPADPKQVAAILDVTRQRSGQAYVAGLQQSIRDASVRMIKPSTDLALAREAMGVDAAMAARVDKANAAAAGARPAH